MRQIPTTQSGRRKGVVAVFVAFILTGLVGVTALTVDGGVLHLQLRKSRATADAAAMAAACELFRYYPTDQGKDAHGYARSAALDVARSNGYSNDGQTSTVVVNIPPASGAYAGKDGFAEVIVTYQVSRAFSRIWGSDTIPVTSRSVSRGAWVAPTAGVIILDYEGKAALNAQGNGAFTETGAPVIVNSNNSSAVLNTGNGKLIAQEFNITGGIQLGGNAALETQPTPGKVYVGTHPTPDPLAYLPPPTMPSDGTILTIPLLNGNKKYILTPGRFTDLPTFTKGDQVILTQASFDGKGVYYIDGGGFKSTGATITMDPVTTGGVLLYNNPHDSAAAEKIQITGNPDGKVNLTGLTDGPYAGMVLWQNRNSGVDMLVEGNGNFSMVGTVYAAGADLNVNGNGKTSAGEITGYYVNSAGTQVNGHSRVGSQFIVKNLSLGGNGNVTLDYVNQPKARTRIISLVE